MRRRRRERPKPMPTEEDKKKAQLRATGADPLVWAMKKVDEEFSDGRVKSDETIKAEAEVEMVMGADSDDIDDEEDILDDIDEEEPVEIKAEGKTAMPMDDGVMMVDVEPMRQNVDNVKSRETRPKKVEGKRAEIRKAEDKKVEGKRIESKKVIPSSTKDQTKLTALESKQKKMVIGLVALVVLALGGVTFGVVAMVNQNQATLELASQIVTSGGHENLVDDEYIYLKDWDMKIKLVSGLTDVSFDYDQDEYSKILVWGARKDTSANYTPDFAKQSKNGKPLGIVTRVPRYERAAAGRLIWYDDYYNYYYQGPSGEPKATEAEMDWWVESYLLIKEMLTNADNYIKYSDSTIGQQ